MGFLYDGVSSQSMKLKARLFGWQASPSLRNSFVTIPGKFGVADFGGISAERTLTVLCGIMPQKGFAALVSVLDAIAEWLDPAQGLRQLVLDDVPDRYFMARLSGTIDCERLIRSAGMFDLQFTCPDPHAYAMQDEKIVITTPGNHALFRAKGNTRSDPVYFLKAKIPDGNTVNLRTNADTLQIVGPLFESEILVIDSGLLTAKVTDEDGTTLRNGLLCLGELNFPLLEKGGNTIEITVDGGAEFEALTIHAKSRWR